MHRRKPWLLATLLLSRLLSCTLAQILINAGGPEFDNGKGMVWGEDDYFYKGGTWKLKPAQEIKSTKADALFLTERYSKTSMDPLRYDIPVDSNGEYDVTLYFSENYKAMQGNGRRLFHVIIEGVMAMPNVDIFKEAKGGFKATQRKHRATAVNGALRIEFVHIKGNPKVNAIEIRPAPKSKKPHPDIRAVVDVRAGVKPVGRAWADSYSVGDQCYCMSTFDHGIDIVQVETELGWMTVKQVCDLLGPGPGAEGRPIYNDIQCGNGPPNDAGDEHVCPGRVDIGEEGCGQIGPTWDFGGIFVGTQQASSALKVPSMFIDAGGISDDGSGFLPKGETWKYTAKSNFDVKGTTDMPPSVYRTHRSGRWLSYSKGGFVKGGLYKINLGFAEIWEKNCKKGQRVLTVKINGSLYNNDLDVYKEAGCGRGLVKSYVVRADQQGRLRIGIGAKAENAMVSFIQIEQV